LRRSEVITSIIDALRALNIPIYEWRVTPAEFNELPIIVVRDKEDNVDDVEVSGSAKHTLKVEIEYTTAKKDLSTKDVREVISSILNSLKIKYEKTPIADYTRIRRNKKKKKADFFIQLPHR
jgi:tRNA G10  N-methylase Trm11